MIPCSLPVQLQVEFTNTPAVTGQRAVLLNEVRFKGWVNQFEVKILHVETRPLSWFQSRKNLAEAVEASFEVIDNFLGEVVGLG